MRFVIALLCVAGCSSDPCDDFDGRTCITVEVHGDPALRVDQLRVTSTELGLADAPSPPTPRPSPSGLPVTLAVVPHADFAGSFGLLVRAFDKSVLVGLGERRGLSISAHQHATVEVDLGGGSDAGADLAPAPVDGGAADLADRSCDPLTQAGCLSSEKCSVASGSGLCRPNGSVPLGGACGDCVRGTECIDGICLQLCSTDGDCHQAAEPSGTTPEPANVGHCLVATPSPSVKACTFACNPAPAAGASGCPSGFGCIDRSQGMIAELTECVPAGMVGEGSVCPGGFSDCAAGLTCTASGATQRCRQGCRAGVAADCTAPATCQPFTGATMFGVCCPTGGC
jgi:hypothetical protein